MKDVGTLATVASIIAGFGGTMLVFRIQRELQMLKQGETIWIAYAERLLISATLISLLLVIVPIVSFSSLSGIFVRLPAAGSSAAAILLAGYILAIQAHYRLIRSCCVIPLLSNATGFYLRHRWLLKTDTPTHSPIIISVLPHLVVLATKTSLKHLSRALDA